MDLNILRKQLRARLPDVVGDLRALADGHGRSLPREAGYTIRAASDDSDTVVRIYDEIWWLGVNAQDLVAELDGITTPTIRVEINSPGGDVFDGIAIYNALRSHPATVTTRVDGVAASIASVIAQAGDRRLMMSSSQMMIHNAWGMTVGDARDHGEMQRLLEQQDDIIAGIYASRSGGDRDEFRGLMASETWLSDEAAVAAGLADEVVDPSSSSSNDPAGSSRTTLNDEIAGAMDVVQAVIDSAERVAALRADVGKDLSTVNVESLDGLRTCTGRLAALLDTSTQDDVAPDVVNEFARFVALTQEMHA